MEQGRRTPSAEEQNEAQPGREGLIRLLPRWCQMLLLQRFPFLEALPLVIRASPSTACEIPSVRGGQFSSAQQHMGESASLRVAVTFDDGPSPATAKILDSLKEFKARATFFVVGREAQKYQHLLSRILEDGHEIGNHSWSHPHLIFRSAAKIREEIALTHHLVADLTGVQMRWFRPPFGQRDLLISKMARELNYTPVLWSVSGNDWKKMRPGTIARRILLEVCDGEIILLHDGRQGFLRDGNQGTFSTSEALPLILAGLSEMGYRSVTLSELLGGLQVEDPRQGVEDLEDLGDPAAGRAAKGGAAAGGAE